LVPDAGEVVLHELKTDGQNRLVMVLRSAGKEGCCPNAAGRHDEFTADITAIHVS
jgi:hypothetical protein